MKEGCEDGVAVRVGKAELCKEEGAAETATGSCCCCFRCYRGSQEKRAAKLQTSTGSNVAVEEAGKGAEEPPQGKHS